MAMVIRAQNESLVPRHGRSVMARRVYCRGRTIGDAMTLDDLIALQTEVEMRDRHLVYIGVDGFKIAHTDVERVSETPLVECELHEWLSDLDEAPFRPGVYVAYPHEPDAYSESYHADSWDFEQFDFIQVAKKSIGPTM